MRNNLPALTHSTAGGEALFFEFVEFLVAAFVDLGFGGVSGGE